MQSVVMHDAAVKTEESQSAGDSPLHLMHESFVDYVRTYSICNLPAIPNAEISNHDITTQPVRVFIQCLPV